LRARRLAEKKGLDPERIVCREDCDGLNCFGDNESYKTPKDLRQEAILGELEGKANLEKFYRKIEETLKLINDRRR